MLHITLDDWSQHLHGKSHEENFRDIKVKQSHVFVKLILKGMARHQSYLIISEIIAQVHSDVVTRVVASSIGIDMWNPHR
jgi:hypothetical protein